MSTKIKNTVGYTSTNIKSIIRYILHIIVVVFLAPTTIVFLLTQFQLSVMKLQLLSISSLSLLLLLLQVTEKHAFSSTTSCSSRNRVIDSNHNPVVLSAAADESSDKSTKLKNKPLTPKEILARQREKQGLSADADEPKLYSDEILNNLQQILLTMEKRVKEGPGSVTSSEVDEFVVMSQNVLDEMKQKEYERLEDASSITSASTPVDVTASSTSSTIVTNPDDNSEGPGFSPSGGNGSLAKGTTNTYIIPGMDEMNTEEYREALQKSISDRQTKRKGTGNYGNRQTWDYLNNLNGVASGPSKKK
jgi:hypothetical protein